MGKIPMHWYDDLPHIGYNMNGKKVFKPARGDELDKFLATIDDPSSWTTAFDKSLQMDKPLTSDELEIIKRLQSSEVPDANYDPYEPTIEWFSGKGNEEIMPLSAAPEPKRRWIPSKWEKNKVCADALMPLGTLNALQIMKIVRAIRDGRIVPNKPRNASDQPQFFALWDSPTSAHTPPLTAPKVRLPTNAESYNPPAEYLLSAEEQKMWQEDDNEDRKRDYIPHKYSALRLVPAYAQ